MTPSPTNRPIPAPNARTTQITAHHPNPKNHSSDTAPSPHPTLAPHKSQPITQIPKITVQTPPHPRTQRSHHTNHSPSPKSQNHSPTNRPHPRTQRSHHTNHSPSPKSQKSQFRHRPIPCPKNSTTQITAHQNLPQNHSSDNRIQIVGISSKSQSKPLPPPSAPSQQSQKRSNQPPPPPLPFPSPLPLPHYPLSTIPYPLQLCPPFSPCAIMPVVFTCIIRKRDLANALACATLPRISPVEIQ